MSKLNNQQIAARFVCAKVDKNERTAKRYQGMMHERPEVNWVEEVDAILVKIKTVWK